MEQVPDLERRVSGQNTIGLSRRECLKILGIWGLDVRSNQYAFLYHTDEKAKPVITIKTDGSIFESEGQRLIKEVADADEIISKYLNMHFAGTYKLDVAESHPTSRALIHVWAGNRGRIDFPTRGVKRGNSAVIHEVTHVITPNYNRFLAEGLAVYVQDKLSTKSVPPTYGANLHNGAAGNELKLEDLIKETKDYSYYWSRRNIGTAIMRNAYFHATSFVKFLIENDAYGIDEQLRLEKFKKLYALADKGNTKMFEIVYGKPLAELEKEWRLYIEKRKTELPQITIAANNKQLALIS